MNDGRRMRSEERNAHWILVDYWIKVIGAAFADDGDGTALEAVAREVAGPRLQIKLTTISPAEEHGLRQVLDRLERHRVAEIGLNIVACTLLVRWLAESSGWSVAEILGRLRAELSGPDLPPSVRGDASPGR